MLDENHGFDPWNIDESDESSDIPQSIDNWTPTAHKKRVPRSAWRYEENNGRFDLRPDVDDLRKIEGFIKRKFDDYDIMQAFGINAETLIAIKNGKYDPLNGISLDNQSKIYLEFEKVESEIQKLSYALTIVVDILTESLPSLSVDTFKMSIGYKAIKKKQREQQAAEEARELAEEERRLKKKEPKTPKALKVKVEKPKKEKLKSKRVNITLTKKGHLTKFE